MQPKIVFFLSYFLQYDEIIPDEMDTDRGGFYINSGQLQYKRLSNLERDGETKERTPNPRKVNWAFVFIWE